MNQVDEEGFDPALQDDEGDAGLTPERRESDDEPDVLLDVPELRVDEISLEVEDLRARVALQADVLSLLRLHVGVEAELGRVQLTIKGVEAQALLKVRLDNVARIIDRVLTTIDNNPEIVEGLIEQVGEAAEEVGAGAGQALGELAPGAGSAVDEGRQRRPEPPWAMSAGVPEGRLPRRPRKGAGQVVNDGCRDSRVRSARGAASRDGNPRRERRRGAAAEARPARRGRSALRGAPAPRLTVRSEEG